MFLPAPSCRPAHRALFLADSVVQLVLSENKAGRADAKIELSTIVSKVSSCPCLPH